MIEISKVCNDCVSKFYKCNSICAVFSNPFLTAFLETFVIILIICMCFKPEKSNLKMSVKLGFWVFLLTSFMNIIYFNILKKRFETESQHDIIDKMNDYKESEIPVAPRLNNPTIPPT